MTEDAPLPREKAILQPGALCPNFDEIMEGLDLLQGAWNAGVFFGVALAKALKKGLIIVCCFHNTYNNIRNPEQNWDDQACFDPCCLVFQ
jgi:hypothetical protein